MECLTCNLCLGDSMYDCPSRSVPEILSHVAGTLSNQPTNKPLMKLYTVTISDNLTSLDDCSVTNIETVLERGCFYDFLFVFCFCGLGLLYHSQWCILARGWKRKSSLYLCTMGLVAERLERSTFDVRVRSLTRFVVLVGERQTFSFIYLFIFFIYLFFYSARAACLCTDLLLPEPPIVCNRTQKIRYTLERSQKSSQLSLVLWSNEYIQLPLPRSVAT